MAVTLCVLLWARDGCEGELVEYEDQLLRLVPEHGGRVIQRARGAGTGPLEAHLLEFPSDVALRAYMDDERRAALAEDGRRLIARAEVLRVELV